MEIDNFATIRDAIESPKDNVIDFLIKYKGEVVDKNNFVIAENWGELVINRIYFVVSTQDGEWTYDGEYHDNKDSFDYSALPVGHSVETTKNYAKIKEVEQSPMDNTVEYIVKYKGEAVDMYNFIITENWGELNLIPYALTITTDDGEWTYDGKAHDKKDSLDYSTLPLGHTLSVVKDSYATITNVNESGKTNTIDFTITYKGETVNSSNFDITKDYGTFIIKPYNLKIVSSGETWDYDGEYHYNNNYDYVSELPEGMRIELSQNQDDWVGVKERGETKENVLAFWIVDEHSNTIDESNFKIDQTEKGKLSIKMPIDVIIKTPDGEWVYDGQPHSITEGWKVFRGELPEGCQLVVSSSTNQTDVTTGNGVDNRFIKWAILDQSGNEIWNSDMNEDEVCVKFSYGKLKITKQGGFDANGNGGGSGVGGAGDNFNGSLSKKPFGASNVTVMTIKSMQAGTVYLRGQSFGDYDGSGFGTPEIYTGSTNELYFTANALNNVYTKTNLITITNQISQKYYLPYYTISPTAIGNDVYISELLSSETYDVNTLMYDYLSSTYSIPLNTNAAEIEYRSFVERNYLNIDTNLQNELKKLTNGMGFTSSTDASNIAKMASYIQGAATYNMDFAEFPEGEDVVLYFLTEGKEGVCQHFAAAATMLFRAYGIPARYTVGYSVYANREKVTDVKASNAHAWVEIYVNGLGWVQVEVTGGGNIEPPTQEKPTLSIKTTSKYKKYDGTALSNEKGFELVSGVLYTGDRLELDETKPYATITEIGKIKNTLTVKVVNADGEDVSSQYNIICEEKNIGTLWVYKAQIIVGTENLSKEYDGKPLGSDISGITYLDSSMNSANSPIWIDARSDALDSGHRVKIKGTNTTITNKASTSNAIPFVVVDAAGNEIVDDTYYYKAASYGKLEITSRAIEISSATREITYNPSNLITLKGEFADLSVTSATGLADGDYIDKADMTAEPISKPGVSENLFSNVVIKNQKGEDVTSNYKLTFKYGSLIILKP